MRTLDRALFDAADDVRDRVAVAATRPATHLVLRRRRRTFVVATAVTLLIIGIPASLTLFRPSVGPRPVGAVAISEADLPSDALTAVAELRAGDELYLLPTGEHWVFARVRPGEPSLMFGTSCDVMSDTPLPEGWVGLCLEYTSNGHRVSGRFPYGTRSNGSTIGPEDDSPGGPIDIPNGPLASSLQYAVNQIPELAAMTPTQPIDQTESGHQWGMLALAANDGSRIELITQVTPENFDPQYLGSNTIHEIGPAGEDIYLRENTSSLQVIVINANRTMLNLIVDRLKPDDPGTPSLLSQIQPDQAKEWALLLLDLITP